MKTELQLPCLRVIKQSVPGTESSKFKRPCGDRKLRIFPLLKVNCMAGALRTKNQVVYDEARDTGKTQTVFILKWYLILNLEHDKSYFGQGQHDQNWLEKLVKLQCGK